MCWPAARRSARSTCPRRWPAAGPMRLESAFADLPSLKAVESRYARFVLDSCGANRREAARILGVSEVTLWRRIKKGAWGPTEAGGAGE